MPENPTPPDRPASGDLPPETPREAPGTPPEPPRTPVDETATFDTTPPEPARDEGRARRFVGHRATPIVAAGLAGLLIGGGTMALIAYTGDDDRRPRAEVFRDGDDGPYFDRRGPMMRDMPMRPWRERDALKDQLKERLKNMPVPEHHHDEDGNMVPGPAPEKGGN
jgi:hypothetical protein